MDEAPVPVEMQIPLARLELTGADVNIVPRPGGGKMIVVGPILLQVGLPLDEEAAAAIAAALTGSDIIVAPGRRPRSAEAVKGKPTPRRRTARLLLLARWATESPRSSLLGMFSNEAQLRALSYRGSSGVTAKVPAPRYASTSRRRHRSKRRSAHMLRLRNISLRSTTAMARRAGVELGEQPVATQFVKHEEWGLIKLNKHVRPEQRGHAARREERQASRTRSHAAAPLQRDLETAGIVERLMRGTGLLGKRSRIRTAERGA